jgi:endonuclease/exonuclease/phosphatase family metal-dependent hydrolase
VASQRWVDAVTATSAARTAGAAALGLLAGLALGACGVALGPDQPWQPIDQSGTSDMSAEVVAPGTLQTTPVPPAAALRVVTYNTEYGEDPEGLAAAILAAPELAHAGLFLLQEEESYPGEGESRARRLAGRLGLGYLYIPARHKADGTHGLALMSALPIDNVQKMDLPLADNGVQRIAVSADVHAGDRTLHVIDVHLETRLNPRDRVAQLHPAMIDAADSVLVAGDFNTNWISWAGSVPVLANDRDQAPIIDSYMASLAFDAPSAHSGATEHAYGLEFKLDSFYTRQLDVVFGGVVHTGPSDHWPMYLDVNL